MIFKVNRLTLGFFLICIYPIINLIFCYIFSGDGMNKLSFLYCICLIFLLLKEDLLKQPSFIFILYCLLVTITFSLFREPNVANFSQSLFYSTIVIMFFIYGTSNFDLLRFSSYLLKKRKLLLLVHLGFFLILFMHYIQNGFFSNWNTQVLSGPYNLPHTLSYLLLFMLLSAVYLWIAGKYKIMLLIAIIDAVLILLTAVRTTLLSLSIVILFILAKHLKKGSVKYILGFFILFTIFLIVSLQNGFLDALIEKTKFAASGGDFTNGRLKILISSLQGLVKEPGQISFSKVLLGIGLGDLLVTNQMNLGVPIHAHNDFADVFVCYGFVNLCIYFYAFISFCRKGFLWIIFCLGILAFANGLYMYIDSIPLIIYARLLFEAKI